MHNAVWGGGWCLPSSRQLFLELHMHSSAKIEWWTMVKMQKNISAILETGISFRGICCKFESKLDKINLKICFIWLPLKKTRTEVQDVHSWPVFLIG